MEYLLIIGIFVALGMAAWRQGLRNEPPRPRRARNDSGDGCCHGGMWHDSSHHGGDCGDGGDGGDGGGD